MHRWEHGYVRSDHGTGRRLIRQPEGRTVGERLLSGEDGEGALLTPNSPGFSVCMTPKGLPVRRKVVFRRALNMVRNPLGSADGLKEMFDARVSVFGLRLHL